MIELIAGKQGSGKTLYASGQGLKYMKKKRKVYCNFCLKGAFILPDDWYNYQYSEGSVLIFDEAQMTYNCRDYSDKARKEEYKKLLAYLTMVRHYGLHIVFITQSLGRLDVQIRDLATEVLRFKKTYKIPYLWLKDGHPIIKFLPILSSGRYFDDVLDVDRYLSSTIGWDKIGRPFFKLPSFKAMRCYDTHVIDEEYLRKKFIDDNYWKW